ncbi:FAD/NAD(P)-binding protein [Kitasatospora sp. NPDC057223]|uniref:FAD/NAD(P)-binding protein n=1 Tax=Kitasatospora sp. NPDC057223 TaxID=3346055 RepID=UPI00363DE44F
MSSAISIAIIGGGASAVCLIDALAQRDTPAGSLTVFEPSPHLWRGRAYQSDTTTVRVNATPDDMSVRAGDERHFERWLRTRDRIHELPDGVAGLDPQVGARFAPRTEYGEYLEQTAHAGLAKLRLRGWRVDLVSEPVTSASHAAGRAMLRTGAGRVRAFDYAVLCVGGDSPKDVYGLAGAEGFVADPYPITHKLQTVGPDQHVAVIGSGLTAVDIIISLAARGHRGRISLLSRRGMLPGVRQKPVHFELKHVTPERMKQLSQRQTSLRLHEIATVIGKEFADAGADLTAVLEEITGAHREHPVERLRRQLAAVDSPDLGLRILQRAVPDTGPDIWPLLSERDKVELLRTHYRTIMSLCCPMPPSSASELLRLADAGQLSIHSGLQDISAGPDGGFLVETAEQGFTADAVVNAVNASEGKIPFAAVPLVNSLTRSRIADRHPHGGLHIARATSRLAVEGRPEPRWYALGNIAAGTLFFTFGIPSLVDRSQDIVRAVLAHSQRVSSLNAERVLQDA